MVTTGDGYHRTGGSSYQKVSIRMAAVSAGAQHEALMYSYQVDGIDVLSARAVGGWGERCTEGGNLVDQRVIAPCSRYIKDYRFA